MAQECSFTPEERRKLSYNLPPLEPLAKYARNQCKFLHVVPRLEVRPGVVLKKVTIWRDHNGQIKYYFDPDEAARFVEWMEDKGRHLKGKWRGQKFEHAHWQLWITKEFTGWRRIGTAFRRYRFLFDFVPRKNGKSLYLAILLLALLTIDGEMAPEIYDCAVTEDQSQTLFAMALEMAGYEEGKEFADEDLLELLITSKKLIQCPFNGGLFRPMPNNSDAFHGKNPHVVCVSEYHTHKDDGMRNVGETGQGVRDQPAILIDTTAGDDVDTPCYEELILARDIVDGTSHLPHYLPIVFEAGPDDEWDSLETARKANPMFGISLSPGFFEQEIAMCRLKPKKKREYLQLQLNRYVQDKDSAFDYDEWIKGREKFDFRKFRGNRLFGGFDLASVDDLTALVNVCAPDGVFGDWYVHAHFWCPEKAVIAKRQTANYELWKEKGFIVATPGSATDWEYITKQICAWHRYMGGYELLLGDRYNATQMANKMINEEGVPIEFIGQGTASMTEPIKFIETLVKSGRLKHNNPVLDWMVKHALLEGNDRACKFAKKKDDLKIDGLVALAMAVAAALRKLVEPEGGSGIWIEEAS